MRLISDVDVNTMYPGVVAGVNQVTTRGGRSVCDSVLTFLKASTATSESNTLITWSTRYVGLGHFNLHMR